MTLLNLWGLIALISLIILLLIYILRPNYQQNFISSTHIWKLSLKYKKKKVPISKLKNIILIICQVLILVGLTLVLMKPVKILKVLNTDESLYIIDASCSMRVGYDGETRFEKAVNDAKEKISDSLESGETISAVLAAKKPYYLFQRANLENKEMIMNQLDSLIENFSCEYGESDLKNALSFAQDLLIDNPNTTVHVYTDQEILYPEERIDIHKYTNLDEYNVAILEAHSEVIDNFFCFVIDTACYGRDDEIEIVLSVYAANVTDDHPQGDDFEFETTVSFHENKTTKVVFASEGFDVSIIDGDENTVLCEIPITDRIFSYESAHVSISEDDSFAADNYVDIYGGKKEELKVLYASSLGNNFWNGALLIMQDLYKNKFDVKIDEFKGNAIDLPNSGYDLYVYEHDMLPMIHPTDGVVIYSDPLADVNNAGFRFGGTYNNSRIPLPFTEEKTHPITNKMVADNITCSAYNRVYNLDGAYEVLMTCDNNPVVAIKDEPDNKTILLLFSMHYSNLPILMDFPIFMYNVFDYFLPATIDGNSFEVNDDVEVRSRGNSVTIDGNGFNETIDTFPSKISVSLPGTYTFTQETHFGKDVSEKIFVKIPAAESNIFPTIDTLTLPAEPIAQDDLIKDLLFYIAIAICALGFLEWILKGNDAV